MKGWNKVACITSLIGAAFCILNGSGAHILCFTQGCDLYKEYSLFGISFYSYGAAGFLTLLFLSLDKKFSKFLGASVATILLLDAFFLAYQYLFWPCTSCLFVALLLGIIALATLKGDPFKRKFLKPVFALWLIFFSFGSLAAAKEMFFKPWTIFGNENAPVKVYFSPTCASCEDVVLDLMTDPTRKEEIAFIPVAKSEEDEKRIARFLEQQCLQKDTDICDIFVEAETFETLSLPDKFKVWSNKIQLAQKGVTTVPTIISPYPIKSAPSSFQSGINSYFSPAEPNFDGCSPFANQDSCEE